MTDLPRFSQSPTDPDFVQDPYRFYTRLRAAGPVVWWDDYAMPMASTHDAVHMALRDNRFGRAPIDAPAIPDHLRDFYAVDALSMLELEPPMHTRLRALVGRAFTSRRLRALQPHVQALCDELVDGLQDGADAIADLAAPLAVTVIARLLGVDGRDAPRLLRWSHDMVGMYQAGRTHADELAANAAARDFAAYLRAHVDARRATPGDDLISELIAAEAQGERLNADELVATCILLLNAGHEATVQAMGNAIRTLVQNAGVAALLNDPVRATEETLRYDPPMHLFTRYVYEDTVFHGAALQRGDQIGLLLASANRDDDAFGPDADVFDPHRTPRNHATFGAGIHFCVAAPLARMELALGLRTLFTAHPNLQIASLPRFADTYHFHGLTDLRLSL
ncbi:cytochrome P450 [Aliiroseovarius sp. PTFE2010]|uniref:cytochrome P450 n=1 Tax=Aliiroseovarius sp. PTFE2010 TaxID=3417190 RepID=UPI003CEB268D